MMLPKIWIHPILIMAVMLLTGCSSRATMDDAGRSNHPENVKGAPKTYVYECSNAFSFVVRVDDDVAWLFLPYKTLRLNREPSASGEKFSDNRTIFWIKGDAALLEYSNTSCRNCINNRQKAIWEHAKLNGVDFRAVGNEPGWFVEIRDNDSILFVIDYGNSRLKFNAPEPVVDQKERTTIYQTKSGRENLIVVIEGRQCTDSMSGEVFETTVQVQLDQKRYLGCGRALH